MRKLSKKGKIKIKELAKFMAESSKLIKNFKDNAEKLEVKFN